MATRYTQSEISPVDHPAFTYFSAKVDVAAGATETLKANAAAGVEVWLYGYSFHAGVAAGTYVLLSDTTPLTGAKPVGVNGGGNRDRGYLDGPILKCAAAEALKMTTVGCAIDGEINGYLVDTSLL